MKNIILSITCIVCFVACEKDNETQTNETSSNYPDSTYCGYCATYDSTLQRLTDSLNYCGSTQQKDSVTDDYASKSGNINNVECYWYRADLLNN